MVNDTGWLGQMEGIYSSEEEQVENGKWGSVKMSDRLEGGGREDK